VNFMNMPQLFYHWAQSLPGSAFHYDTTTPSQLTRTYIDYIFNNYPPGSFDMRPLNLTSPTVILSARKDSLTRLFESFPSRKFILIGDSSSSTLLKAYPEIAQQFPSQMACIFIRNTSATDGEDHLPFDTSPFENLNRSMYFFYTVPDDLLGLDIVGGGVCE
jgi:phosphatidate phosphatase APP1